MSKTLARALAILGALLVAERSAQAAQMRSRAEAVPGVQASNTAGLGDIWVTTGVGTRFRIRPVLGERLADMVDSAYRDDFRALYGSENRLQRDLRMVPMLGATIGLANFLQLDLQASDAA